MFQDWISFGLIVVIALFIYDSKGFGRILDALDQEDMTVLITQLILVAIILGILVVAWPLVLIAMIIKRKES